MTNRVNTGNIQVATVLWDFINTKVLPGTGVKPEAFWAGVDVLNLSEWHEEEVVIPPGTSFLVRNIELTQEQKYIISLQI